MDIDKQILEPIDAAQEHYAAHRIEDHSNKIEEEVWNCIVEGVPDEYGMDEALNRFLAWRTKYVLGKLALGE